MTETGTSGGDGRAARALARQGIRAWAARIGGTFLHTSPLPLLTGMAAAALAPILVPALAGTAGPAAVQQLLGQFGSVGAGYLTSMLQETVGELRRRPGPAGITEETLREVLKECLDEALSGQRAAEIRSGLVAVIRSFDGVDVTFQAVNDSDPGLAVHVAQALRGLADSAAEFRPLHDDLLESIEALQRNVATTDANVQRTYDAVQRISLTLAQVHRLVRPDPAAGPVGPADRDNASPAPPPEPDAAIPYFGLEPFTVEKAGWFYGRGRLVDDLISGMNARLYNGTPLVVVGASGAGKSSLLAAGLMPEIRGGGLAAAGSRDWPLIYMTPDRQPLRDLGVNLAHRAGIPSSRVFREINEDPAATPLIVRQALLAEETRGRLVLIIDQFEEVFTQRPSGQPGEDAEESRKFIEAVSAIASGTPDDPAPALVVICVRSDFLDQCAAHPELAPALRNPFVVGPMTPDELREAIEQPARQAGLVIEPGLADTMLGDIGAVEQPGTAGYQTYEPGKLPLLAHALLRTWKRRDGSTLTIAAYQAVGGIRDALAQSADSLYESLDEHDQQVAKRLLLRMIARHQDAEDTRRRVSRAELLDDLPAADRETAGSLLDRLSDERLVTADEKGVQIAHEALLRYWPTLAGWLREDRDWHQKMDQLSAKAREWDDNQRHRDQLLRGRALEAAQEGLDGRRDELGEIEKSYLLASEQGEARSRRNRKLTMSGLAALALIFAGLAVAVQYSSTLASHQRAVAQSGQFAAEAAALRTGNPAESAVLSLRAYRAQPDSEAAVSSLLTAQAAFPIAAFKDPAGPGHAVAYDPADPRLLAVAGHQDAVTVWNAAGGQQRPVLTLRGNSPFYSVAFSGDGRLLAGAEQDGTAVVWNMDTRQQVTSLGAPGDPPVNAVSFGPRGDVIATAGEDGNVTLWRASDYTRIGVLPAGTIVSGLTFSPDGTQIAAACSDHDVRVWHLARPGAAPLVLRGHTAPVRAAAFSPDSKSLASASDDGTVLLWDARTGTPQGELRGGTSEIDSLSFNPSGTLLASGGTDHAVRIWDVSTLSQETTLTESASAVTGVAFGPDGRTIADTDSGGTISLWDVTPPPPPGTAPTAAIAMPDRRDGTIATAGEGPDVALWKPGQNTSYALIHPAAALAAPGGRTPSIALSPDGATVAAISLPGNQAELWNTLTRRLIRILSAPSSLTVAAYDPAATIPVIAAGGSDGDVFLWTTGGSSLPQRVGGLPSQVTAVTFRADGNLLAAGSQDGSLEVASRNAAGRWTPLQGPLNLAASVEALDFSPDGRVLATASAGGVIQLRSITGAGQTTRLTTLNTPAAGVVSVAFSDGGTLAASFDDGSIRLWDVRNPASPAPLATISGLTTATSVAWRPGTRELMGASADGTLLRWDTDPDRVANRICSSGLAGGDSTLCPGQ